MPFAHRRAPIVNVAPFVCPRPKQIVHGLGLYTELSELHLDSDIGGLKLVALIKQSISSHPCQILGKQQVTSLGQ